MPEITAHSMAMPTKNRPILPIVISITIPVAQNGSCASSSCQGITMAVTVLMQIYKQAATKTAETIKNRDFLWEKLYSSAACGIQSKPIKSPWRHSNYGEDAGEYGAIVFCLECGH